MGEDKERYKTFEEMYLRVNKLVYVFIYDQTCDYNFAEEVASTIWVKIAESPEMYLEKDIGELHNYIRIMVKNEIAQQFRMALRQKKQIEKLSDISTVVCSAEETYILQDMQTMLLKARKQLSKEEELLLTLRFDKNCSVKETSEVMGITISAVKMRQKRLLLKLKKMME